MFTSLFAVPLVSLSLYFLSLSLAYTHRHTQIMAFTALLKCLTTFVRLVTSLTYVTYTGV